MAFFVSYICCHNYGNMQELVIASNNKGKIKEIKEIITGIKLLSLADIGFSSEIEEPYDTFNENAYTKAKTISDFCGKSVFADDSGICVNALNGAPGVHSAIYGGEPRSNEANNKKLIEALKGVEDRSAYYKAVICLIWNAETHYFDGHCHGKVLEAPSGEGGFGYDPLFVPHGYDKSFAELPPEVKNNVSHRGEAVSKMVAFLNTQISK